MRLLAGINVRTKPFLAPLPRPCGKFSLVIVPLMFYLQQMTNFGSRTMTRIQEHRRPVGENAAGNMARTLIYAAWESGT